MPNVKIMNREPAGGASVIVKTFDLKDRDEEGKQVEPFLSAAGEQELVPGEELELLVNATRTFSVAEATAAPQKKKAASQIRIGRDAETGHFKSVEAAKADPGGSTVETVARAEDAPKGKKGVFGKK